MGPLKLLRKTFIAELPPAEWLERRPIILMLGWQADVDRYADAHQWTYGERQNDIVTVGSAYHRQVLRGTNREILIVDGGDFWERANEYLAVQASEVLSEAKRRNRLNGY
jgi:hypothetical protein